MNRYRHKRTPDRSTQPGFVRQGFTMVELLVVVLIMGILMSIALGTFNGIRAQGWRTRARNTALQVSQAWSAYLMDQRELPARDDLAWDPTIKAHETTEANLSLIAPRSGRAYLEVSTKEWDAGLAAYPTGGGLIDPWKRRYRMRLDNEPGDTNLERAYDGVVRHPCEAETNLYVRTCAVVWSLGNTPGNQKRWIVQW